MIWVRVRISRIPWEYGVGEHSSSHGVTSAENRVAFLAYEQVYLPFGILAELD